jgi:hypothetical protein
MQLFVFFRVKYSRSLAGFFFTRMSSHPPKQRSLYL